ncbi:hypothetical protein RYH73_09455 [Olivibacter sp. CPCC 100613]|uniref:hypothetical protein n=1 Tax=Olivibacter sp. CPCC 100613 TaxID=3079931 RepID=UPI002FF52FFB
MEKKKLDELFREGLKNPEASYDEVHWIAMEEKLASNRKKRQGIIWLGSLSAAAAIILACLIIWWPTTRDTVVEVTEKKDSMTSKRAPVEKIIPPINDQVVKGSHIQKESRGALVAVPEKNNDHGAGRIEQVLAGIYKDTLKIHSTPDDFVGRRDGNLSLAPVYVANALLTGENTAPELKMPRKRTSAYLTILAAPDLTTVQGAGNPQLSRNMGVLYTLPLTHKLSISGGVLYARKNYNSPYSFYRPKVQRNYALTPSEVDAACDVLDVPIELSYQVYQKGATRIVVNGGASSYFMLREQYEFSYHTGDSYQDKQHINYEVNGKNNHPFGVANISATFEQQLNNKVSIGVRPFVKLPLTGVGYGRTKLESKGLAVSVSFKLGNKNTN